MKLFKYMEEYDYEQVVFNYDRVSGLKVIIAIHDTTLGPALGGTRIWDYQSEEEALIDVLRLARGMTYKSAAAGLSLGGGKAVIIGDRNNKSEEMWRAYGRFVQSLNGRYITAEDVGTCVEDMKIVARETDYVTGLPGKSGDPSPVTAFGVWQGMKAAVEEVFGTSSLKDRVIAIQGVGHVGYCLAKHIDDEGGRLIITDIDRERLEKVVRETGATPVKADEIYRMNCDIFAPCALGGVINDNTVLQLNCKIVAGAANNVLKEEEHGDMLGERGILYIPDFVINAGGVINVYGELKGYSKEQALDKAGEIYNNIKKVLEISRKEKIPTYKAADILAEERIREAGQKDESCIKKTVI